MAIVVGLLLAALSVFFLFISVFSFIAILNIAKANSDHIIFLSNADPSKHPRSFHSGMHVTKDKDGKVTINNSYRLAENEANRILNGIY